MIPFFGLLACAPTPIPTLTGTYDLVLDASLSVDGSALDGGYRIAGTLDLDEDRGTLSNLTCTGADEAPLDELCAQLETTFGRRLDEFGRVTHVGVPEGLDLRAESLVKHLASAIQLGTPDGRAKTWSVPQIDHTGRYLAEYRWSSSRELVSEKRGYLESRAGQLDGRATTRFWLEGGSLSRVTHQESFAQQTGGATSTSTGPDSGSLGLAGSSPRAPRARGDSRILPPAAYELTLTLERSSAPSGDHHEPSFVWLAPDAEPSEGARKRAIDRGRLGNTPPAQWTRSLLQTMADDPSPDDFVTLVSLLRRYPSQHADVLEACDVLDDRCKAVLAAFGAAATSEAQQSLATFLDDVALAEPVLQATIRREVVRALGTRLHGPPSDATLDVLVSLLDDPLLDRQAAYGLGAVANQAYEAGDVARARRAVNPLLSRWDAASDRDHKLLWARALSNAATPEVADALGPFVGHADPDVARVARVAVDRVQ